MEKKTNFVLVFISLLLVFSLPVIIFYKEMNKNYNEKNINNKIVFYKTNIDKVINNIEIIKSELEVNEKEIKEKQFILSKINDGMKKYDVINDSKLFNNFSKINSLLEKSKIKLITLTYLDNKFILDLLISNQEELDELKKMNYNINKINYENGLFLINMTIGVENE